MTQAKLPLYMAEAINRARLNASDADRKQAKKEIFADAKRLFAIPQEVKVKVETHDTESPNYLVLRRQDDGAPFNLTNDGVWDGAQVAPDPVEYRWFCVDRSAVRDVVLDCMDWDDGNEESPDTYLVPAQHDGDVYIRMPKTDFF